MCSEAIPLQPGYYLPSNLHSQAMWMDRSHGVVLNNYNNALVAEESLRQHFHNHVYINAVAASTNAVKPTGNQRFVRGHAQRNPQFDNYLAGIKTNYDNCHRPKQRDRSSPPDSFNSERFSSNPSGENPVQAISHSDTSAFRPICRQKSAKLQKSNSNVKSQKQPVAEDVRIHENNDEFCRSGSQRRARGYKEKKTVVNASNRKPSGHGTRTPVVVAQRQPVPNKHEQKLIVHPREERAQITPQRRPNRKSNGPSEHPTKPTQANECEIMTRKSRPRRNKRSEFPAKSFNETSRQK